MKALLYSKAHHVEVGTLVRGIQRGDVDPFLDVLRHADANARFTPAFKADGLRGVDEWLHLALEMCE